MFKRFLIVAFGLFLGAIAFSGNAEIPTTYYTSLNGKVKEGLKTELFKIINPHTILSYNSLWTHFKQTDVHTPPDDNQWWDMYSGITFYVRNGSKGLNREHSFPKSWWGGDQIPPYTDINHLYPSESEANMAKSNYPLGVVASTTFDNGYTKVGNPVLGQGGGASRVFEPADEYKGDFARTYFYMVTCYQNLTWKYLYMLQQNSYPTLSPWAYTMLLEWARQDPVSQKEVDRNEAVYRIQNNRNPFIDYPELAEYIWGTKMGQPFEVPGGGGIGDPVLTTPTQGTSLDFSEVAVGSKQTLGLFLKGENLRYSLTVTISGDNKDLFSSPDKSISASLINSANGYWLNITYAPKTVGTHTAKVLLSDGGLTGSVGITLMGQSLPVPILSTLTANAAQNITETGYRASWNEPAEVVDYYIVTRSIFANGTSTTEEIVAEENSYDFDDLTPGTMQTYSVQSSRLGYRSSPSNVITVYPSGVTGVETDQAFAVEIIDGGVRFVCAESHTNGEIFNMQGQLVSVLPVINNGDTVLLPYGAYIIKTKEAKHPVKILIK